MVHIEKSLITSRYNDGEFTTASILGTEPINGLLNSKMTKPARKNVIRRKKSQAKARKSIKFYHKNG